MKAHHSTQSKIKHNNKNSPNWCCQQVTKITPIKEKYINSSLSSKLLLINIPFLFTETLVPACFAVTENRTAVARSTSSCSTAFAVHDRRKYY